MSIQLSEDQINSIMFLINKQFPIGGPADYVGNQEFFWAGDMKPERFDVKLGWSILNDCFVAWDYKDGSVAQSFIGYCMTRTEIIVKARIEDNYIEVLWQDKWRMIMPYYVKRSVPATKTYNKAREIFRLNVGLPTVVSITLDFSA